MIPKLLATQMILVLSLSCMSGVIQYTRYKKYSCDVNLAAGVVLFGCIPTTLIVWIWS